MSKIMALNMLTVLEHDTFVSLKLPSEHRQALRRLAASQDRSMSSVLRELVEIALDESSWESSSEAFFDELGSERRASTRAVSIDMSASYAKAIRDSVPNAEIAFDPFHVVRLAQRAVDQVRRDE